MAYVKLHKNLRASLPDGSEVSVTVEEYTRGGSMSPSSYFIIWNGKRYSPYAQNRIGLVLTVPSYFKIFYSGPTIASLTFTRNPFLELVSKDTGFSGYYPIPLIYGK